MDSYFDFAEQRSKDFGLVIEHVPHYEAAKRRVETCEIPGRHGLLYRDTGCFENVTQRYEVWFCAGSRPVAETVHRIAEWLLGGTGYQRLCDSYDPDVYRRAVFAGPMDVESVFRRFVRVTLEFDCLPQRWLTAGEEEQSITSGSVLTNPGMPARPEIIISGSGAGQIDIGNYSVSISSIPSGGLVIDCDLQDAWSWQKNANGLLTLSNGFPVLEPGDNTIGYSGGVTDMSIIPRWWTL